MIVLERETNDFLGAPITQRNLATGVVTTVSSGVQYSITTGVTRPSVWLSQVVVDGVTGITITGMTPGDYVVWAKLSNAPYAPVIRISTFRIR